MEKEIKQVMLKFDKNSDYYKYIEEQVEKRDITMTTFCKQLIFDRIDNLQTGKKSEDLIEELIKAIKDSNIVNTGSSEEQTEKTKKEGISKEDVLRNLGNIE